MSKKKRYYFVSYVKPNGFGNCWHDSEGELDVKRAEDLIRGEDIIIMYFVEISKAMREKNRHD